MITPPKGNFLIPDATALVEAAVFLVVLFVVGRWVLPRLQEIVERRKSGIERELGEASQALAAARARETQAEDRLREARLEARAILDRAREDRDYLIAQGIRKGREEYEWFSGRRVPPPPPALDERAEALAGAAVR
jgi:F-type H+-transporting ATPase subunit b